MSRFARLPRRSPRVRPTHRTLGSSPRAGPGKKVRRPPPTGRRETANEPRRDHCNFRRKPDGHLVHPLCRGNCQRREILSPLGTNRTREEIRTLNATAPSNFLKNRLGNPLGWRRDRRRERTSLPNVVDPSTGLVTDRPPMTWNRPTDAQGEAVRNSQRGETKTFGAIVKPLTWLNFHYSQSDGFSPGRPPVTRPQERPSPFSRRGQDCGVTFAAALPGKLNVKINRAETAEKGSRAGEVGTIGNRPSTSKAAPKTTVAAMPTASIRGPFPVQPPFRRPRHRPTAAHSASAVAKSRDVTDG